LRRELNALIRTEQMPPAGAYFSAPQCIVAPQYKMQRKFMFIYCKTARFSPKKGENPLLFARPSAVFRKMVPGRTFASPVRIASSARFVYNSERKKEAGRDDFI